MKRALIAIIAMVVLCAAAIAAPGAAKIFLVHVTSPMTKCDERTVFIPHIAIDALERGYKVAILFDDEGVTAVRIGEWYGGHTTSLDKTAIPEEELRILSTRLGVPSSSLPDNYGDFLRFLKGKGVELYANKAAMDLRNIREDRFDHAVTPLPIGKMVEIFERAAVTVSY